MVRIAFFADSHIGYRTRTAANPQGINVRVQDGYDAFRDVVSTIIEEHLTTPIDCVLIAGDLFHSSRPTMRDIATVQHYLRALAKHGLKVVILAGNHDATDIRSELAAIAPIHDPDKNIHAFINPYEVHEIVDGAMLHIVSHHGLHASQSPMVKPTPGVVNIFSTHGAALDPKNFTLMNCAESVREQIIPPELVTDNTFDVKLLGHYHSRYPVGGEKYNTWYSGSLLRRGFSDEAGDRGWMLVTVDGSNPPTFVPHNIHQRPQYDLEIIDAENKTVADITDLIELGLQRTTTTTQQPIVRQKIVNAPRSIRTGIDKKKLVELTKHALTWQLEFTKPVDEQTSLTSTKNSLSLSSKRSTNIVKSYDEWLEHIELSIPEIYQENVINDAKLLLQQAKEKMLQEGS